jgi:hypothetical protein
MQSGILPPTATLAVFCHASAGSILKRMLELPEGQETWESYFGDRRPPSVLRLFKRHLALERKYTERMLNDLHNAMKSEMGLMEQRIIEKLDDINSSLDLIARELARRSDDPPSNDSGS